MLDIRTGDNVDLIRNLIDDSVQLIYFNPPFGTTKQPWDKALNWETLWPEMWRVLKPNGAIIIHASIPFTWELVRQPASKDLKYCYYWNKICCTNHLATGYSPLRCIEEVMVYFKRKPKFNYIANPEYIAEGFEKDGSPYYRDGKEAKKKIGRKGTPKHYLEYPRKTDKAFTRPKELLEFFIQTYTDENDLVLDPTCGRGDCGVVCDELNRRWTGFEIRDQSDL